MPLNNELREHIDYFRLGGLLVALLVNIPSLQLFLPSGPIINAVLLLAVFGSTVVRTYKNYSLSLRKFDLGVSGLIISLLLILLVHLVSNGIEIILASVLDLAGIVFTIMSIILIYQLGDELDVRTFVLVQIVWGTFVGLMNLVVDIRLTGGQHYNTISLPIFLATMCCLGPIFYLDNRTTQFALLGAAITNIISLLTLPGRGPILFTAGFTGFAILYNFFESLDTFSKAVRRIGIRIIPILIALLIIYQKGYISEILMRRFIQLVVDFRSEPRVELYASALKLIVANPLGYGVGVFDMMTEWPYPHNLFLHVLYSGGVTSFIVFAPSVSRMFLVSLQNLSTNPYRFGAMFCMFGLVSTFLISYSITHSYLVFALLTLLYVTTCDPYE